FGVRVPRRASATQRASLTLRATDGPWEHRDAPDPWHGRKQPVQLRPKRFAECSDWLLSKISRSAALGLAPDAVLAGCYRPTVGSLGMGRQESRKRPFVSWVMLPSSTSRGGCHENNAFS